jgi:Transmembrane domain of unknown function (DUF3566)
VPTATDEPSEEPAPEDSAGAQDSLNGSGGPESPNGMHGGHEVTVATEYEADPGTGPEPRAEPELGAEPELDSEPEPEVAAEAPAASIFDPGPGPDVPAAEPIASSIFVRDPSAPATPVSMFTDEEPLPAAAGASPGEEPPAPADDPFSAYRFGPTTDYGSQPGPGYTAGYEPSYVPGYAAEPDYVPGYAAETGYNQGMTQPVEEEAAPAPAYPADLSASSAKGAGAKSTFASAYRSLPRPKPRKRSRGEVVPARRANLVIARLEPWSVMKFSFLMSLVAWVVLFVAVALLYYALSSLGVFESIQRTLASVTSSTTSAGVNLTKWTSASRVLGYTMLIGAVDVVLITALATIGAMVYNLVTHLGGGIEVTLKETD